MKLIALVALLATTGMVQAANMEAAKLSSLSLKSPWLTCPEGTKKIGDDCVPANIDFE
ncbi:hypothetical protein [Pseudomonas sp. microsymbiont 2]